MTYPRYAIYYAPRNQTPLGDFGRHWLGWNGEQKENRPRPHLPDLSEAEIAARTQSPRRYGFHGTLKPPFRLAQSKNAEQLEEALASFSQQHAAIRCGPLELKTIGSFLALVPSPPVEALDDLARACVMTFDEFRAPADENELARRRKAGLSPLQDQLLRDWGYPYVMDEFRFHLTLTDKLDQQSLDQTYQALAPEITSLASGFFEVKDICLFGDPGPGKCFELIQRYPLLA